MPRSGCAMRPPGHQRQPSVATPARREREPLRQSCARIARAVRLAPALGSIRSLHTPPRRSTTAPLGSLARSWRTPRCARPRPGPPGCGCPSRPRAERCARARQNANRSANISSALWGETLGNEARATANSLARPAQRTVLPPPPHHTRFVESSGLERSLSTNIPDHPTAIQVRIGHRRAAAGHQPRPPPLVSDISACPRFGACRSTACGRSARST